MTLPARQNSADAGSQYAFWHIDKSQKHPKAKCPFTPQCEMITKLWGMEPTCYDGQIGVINSLAYLWHEPRRGEIVGLRIANDKDLIIKRIIGLPGERIAFHSGVVFINGKSIAEPYLTSKGAWE